MKLRQLQAVCPRATDVISWCLRLPICKVGGYKKVRVECARDWAGGCAKRSGRGLGAQEALHTVFDPGL